MSHITEPERITVPEPLLSLARSCEVHCVVDCCGVDAFDVAPEHMVPWLREHGTGVGESVLSQLDVLIDSCRSCDGSILSGDFNAIMTGPEFAEYLGGWRTALVEAIGCAFPNRQ